METQTKKPMHEYWDRMNEAMCAIEEAAYVAKNNEEVIEHIVKCGCYEETYDPVFWVIDYIEKMFKD